MACFLCPAISVGTAHDMQQGVNPVANEQMLLAAGYLSRAQLPTGLFPYDLDFATGASADMSNMTGSNLVRQAGTAFALSEYFAFSRSQKTGPTLVRILEALAARSIPIDRGVVQSFLEWSGFYNQWQIWHPLRGTLDDWGLLYVPEGEGLLVSADMSYEKAWPGATAFALLAALNYQATSGDTRFASTADRWLKGLMALHVSGRGIREAPHYLSENGYVNGETWFALARYVESHPEKGDAHALLTQLDDYLMTHYSARPRVQFYNWGMMTALERMRATKDSRFIDFMREQTAWYMADQQDAFASNDNQCFKLEGLASYVQAMRETGRDDELTRLTRDRAGELMRHSMSLQILPGQVTIGLDNGTTVRSAMIEKSAGAFLSAGDSPKIQIDLAGHCLSALIRVEGSGLSDSP